MSENPQDPHKIRESDFKTVDTIDPPLVNRSELAVVGTKQKAKSKAPFTELELNAINSWHNDIKPLLRSMTSSELKSLTPPPGLPSDVYKSAEQDIAGAARAAEKREESLDSKREEDRLNASLKLAETNKNELAKQATEVDKLWGTINSDEHKKKQAEFDAKDEERKKKLTPLLSKENLTEEDLKEARKHRLTDEEIEERKKHWNNISAAYHGLKDLTTGITKESARLGEEIEQLKALAHKEEHHIKHIEELAKHKAHHDKNLDKYNKQLGEAEKEYNKKDEYLAKLVKDLEETKSPPNEVLAQEIADHIKVYGKDHEKDLVNNPNSKDAQNYTKIKETLEKHQTKAAAASKDVKDQTQQSVNKVQERTDSFVNNIRERTSTTQEERQMTPPSNKARMAAKLNANSRGR